MTSQSNNRLRSVFLYTRCCFCTFLGVFQIHIKLNKWFFWWGKFLKGWKNKTPSFLTTRRHVIVTKRLNCQIKKKNVEEKEKEPNIWKLMKIRAWIYEASASVTHIFVSFSEDEEHAALVRSLRVRGWRWMNESRCCSDESGPFLLSWKRGQKSRGADLVDPDIIRPAPTPQAWCSIRGRARVRVRCPNSLKHSSSIHALCRTYTRHFSSSARARARAQAGCAVHLLSCWVVSLPLVSPGDSSMLLPASPTPSSAWLPTISPASSRSSRWLTEKFFLACRLSRFDVIGLSRRLGIVACLSITWA